MRKCTLEVTLTPMRFQYCHCASCRKATSSSHAANLFFALDRFRWVTGESLVERFIDQAANPGYVRWFCRKCGSAVPRLNRTKQYYVVPAGLLDADPIVKPERSVSGMTALRGSLILMQFLSYLKNLFHRARTSQK